MSAELHGRGRWGPPAFTTARLTAGVVVAVLILLAVLFSAVFRFWMLPAYLALVLATAAALRSIRVEPGSWLGRRAVRRALVAALVADCAFLLAGSVWPPLQGPFVVFVILLVLLDVALGRATQRVAAAPEEAVDERQEALRNRAHRLAYGMLAPAVGGTLAVAGVASPQSRAWLENLMATGGFLVFLQLLFVLPAMTLAWLEPDRLTPEDRGRARDAGARLALGLLALTIAAPFLLSVGVPLLPVRTTSSVSLPGTRPGVALEPNPSRCLEFTANARVGVGVEADVPLHAVACWDGRRAYQAWGLNASDCMLADSSLAMVSAERCTRTTGPDGTLRFTYHAVVRPVLLPFWGREVTVGLVLDRDGRVVRFP